MNKTIIMHIGTAKTGTTAIQNFLLNNLDKLRECGIEYPMGNLPFGVFSWTDGNIGNIVGTKGIFAKEKAERIINLCSGNQKVLLSTERVWVEIKDKIAFFSEFVNNGYTVKVIVYLREQAEYLESVYRESVKAGPHLALTGKQLLDDNCDIELAWRKNIENGMHYFDELNKIASVVGKENVIVRVYDKNSFKNGSIYIDFLDAIGIQIDNLGNWVVPEKRINPSLNALELDFMSKINSLKDFYSCQELNAAFFEPISKHASLTNQAIHFETSFSEEERYSIFEKYREENLLLSKEYLNKDADLFEWKTIKNEAEIIDESKIIETLTRVYGITTLDINRKIIALQDIQKQNSGQYENLKKQFDELQKQNREEYEYLQSQYDELQKQNREEYEYLQSQYDELQKQYGEERGDLEKRIFEKQQEIDAIKNGYSWKLTAPLRRIRRLIYRQK